jgi:hypothetical protein
MPVQQETPVVFSGLNLNSKGGGLPVGASPVFHNCDISADGAVIRRAGSTLVGTLEGLSGQRAWSHVVKTRRGSEFFVNVTQSGITVELFVVFEDRPIFIGVWTKTNVFKATLTEVNFTVLSAPFDRLVIFTGNHPPIQLSLLERTLDFTCTNAVNQTVTSPFSSTDSTMWNSNEATSHLLVDFPSSIAYTVTSKSAGFTMNAPSLGMVLSQVRRLTLIQVSWQWWAESITWEGKDFVQAVSRVNVVDTDQNVKIPADLLTDLEPRYLESSYLGIQAFSGSNFQIVGGGTLYTLTNTPNGATEWGHGNGSRYVFSAGAPLNHSPFFATFGAKEASGISVVYFCRLRELRFNAGTGILVANLDHYVNDVKQTAWVTPLVTPPGGVVNDLLLFTDTFTTTRNWIRTPDVNTKATTGGFFIRTNTIGSNEVVRWTNTSTEWLGSSARNVWYRSLTSSGGVLDGTYVATFGVGQYWDYLKGLFPRFGALYRDRLVIRNPDEASDQLLISATADVLVPGEFYSYYQITDGLEGVADDPFTVNVTAQSREKITALLAWQQSLFVFTTVSTYSIAGGETFGPDSYTSGLISRYGAYNPRCVVSSNLTILVLNKYGLFDLLNKSNTSDYGSFERSVSIRDIFDGSNKDDKLDTLPWLVLNDSTNTLMCGIPSFTDTLSTSITLALNLAWNSWSTMGSVGPFQVHSAVQLHNWITFVTQTPNSTNFRILQMEALHNMDYYVALTVSLPHTSSYPFHSFTPTKPLKPLTMPLPIIPVFREYNLLDTAKIGTKYTNTTSTIALATGRNWMIDDATLAAQLPAGFTDTHPPLAAIVATDPRPFYFIPTAYTNTMTDNLTIPVLNKPEGGTHTTIAGYGSLYPSIYATPVLDQDSMGRLKRLKRLHLLFDPGEVLSTRYPSVPDSEQDSSAIVAIKYNYDEEDAIFDTTLVLGEPDMKLRDRYELSIPLQGHGCDYQCFITSVGVDGFKLLDYEFDVKQQPYPYYVRK